MADESLSCEMTGDEFSAFCDFIVQIREQGADQLTPEQSVREFRNYQAQLQQWREKNLLSQQQAQNGEAKPLDDEAVLARLHQRLARVEKSE